MRRPLVLIVGILATWLGAATPAMAAATAPTNLEVVHVYAYDGPHHSAPWTTSTSERGPPAAYDHYANDDAVAHRSHGASARWDASTSRAAYTYNASMLLTSSAVRATTTAMPVGRTEVAFASLTSGSVAAKTAPNPKPVLKLNGAPDRSSPWYVSYRDADGNIQTVGNLDGVHAEVRIQQMQPGAPMSKPFGWRTLDSSKGPEWAAFHRLLTTPPTGNRQQAQPRPRRGDQRLRRQQ